MFKSIEKDGEVLTIGEYSETVDKLFIHLSDYGDDYFDLTICYKETEEMFGSVSWCVIPSSKIDGRIKELVELTNIQDVRRETIKPSEWLH